MNLWKEYESNMLKTYNMELVEGLRVLNKTEFEDLEALCIQDGILDSVKVWGEYLLDGRHRIQIAEKHGLRVEAEELELADLDEAKAWVLKHQLGRRNLTEIEQQKARASLAKLTSIADAAEHFGVTKRTIQRDLEAESAMQLMPDDIRSKCETGEIINSQKDWKRYSDLSDQERRAVDKRLRDKPASTLRDALPKKQDGLSAEDHEAINNCAAFTPQIKQAFAAGIIHADSISVAKLAKLSPDKQELLAVILTDPEVHSLKKALDALKGAGAPKDPNEAIEKCKEDISRLMDRIKEKLNDIGALSNKDTEPYKAPLDDFLYDIRKL